jgi:uncharacterized protein (UPF0218 family)
MPRKLIDEEGNEVEVPTEEESKEAEKKAKEAGVSEYRTGIRKDLKIEDNKGIREHMKDLETNLNPNWKEVRGKLDRQDKLIEQLKKDGKTVDENGNIIDAPAGMTSEEVSEQIETGVKKSTFKNEQEKLLSQYGEEDKKVVEDYLTRLMSGKEQSISNLYNTFKEASVLAFPDRKVNPLGDAINRGGLPPKSTKDTGDLNTEQKELADKLDLSDEDIEKYGK